MADLESVEQVKAYAAEHGDDALRKFLADGVLTGRRKEFVESYIQLQDAVAKERLQKEQNDSSLRAAKAAETQAIAAMSQADSAKQALRISWWAIGISLLALVVAVLK